MGGSDRSCCVPKCEKTRKDDTVLHSFPNPDKEMERYSVWSQAVGIDSSSVDPQFVLKNRKVCHAHFEEKFLTWTRRLGPGAIPTLFLPGPGKIEGPLNEITNTLENVSMQPSMPSTLRGGKHSLQQSGCNTHVNSIGEESVREICEQANPESRSIPNDELCLSDNYTQNNAIIQDSLSINPDRHIISESKSIPNDELCFSDIHTLDNGIQQPLCTSPDRHVSVRIYEENCVNPAGPMSSKQAKLHVSELYQYVGSTSFVSGGFEPNDDEPVEDPLAIHSPDLSNKDSMYSVENIMNVVEGHNVSNIQVEENKSNIEDNNMSDIEDNMSNVEDNMSTVEDNMSNVEDNMSNVEDNMSTVEGNMSNVEDNMSNVDDNMNTVEDNISTEKDNMSFKKDSRHLVDSFVDRDYDDLDLRLEIAYALKFKYQEGKTFKEAVEEIFEKYGRGKLSLEEAKCWYNEFNLGNNIMRIIFSGGPIYK